MLGRRWRKKCCTRIRNRKHGNKNSRVTYPVMIIDGEGKLTETRHAAASHEGDDFPVQHPSLPPCVAWDMVQSTFFATVDHELLETRAMPFEGTTED